MRNSKFFAFPKNFQIRKDNSGNTDTLKYYIRLYEGAYLFKTLSKYGPQAYKVKSSSPKILPLAPCFYTLFSIKDEKYDFVFEATVGAKLAKPIFINKENYLAFIEDARAFIERLS